MSPANREKLCIASAFLALSAGILLAASIALLHPLAGVAAAALVFAALFFLSVMGVVQDPKFNDAANTIAVLLAAFTRRSIVTARDGTGRQFGWFCGILWTFITACVLLGPLSVKQYNVLCVGETGTIFSWLVNPTACTQAGTTVYTYALGTHVKKTTALPLHVIGAGGREMFCHPQADDVAEDLICEPKPPCISFVQGTDTGEPSNERIESDCTKEKGALCISLRQDGKEIFHYRFPYGRREVVVCPSQYVPESRRSDLEGVLFSDIKSRSEISFVVFCSADSNHWRALRPGAFRSHFASDQINFGHCPL